MSAGCMQRVVDRSEVVCSREWLELSAAAEVCSLVRPERVEMVVCSRVEWMVPGRYPACRLQVYWVRVEALRQPDLVGYRRIGGSDYFRPFLSIKISRRWKICKELI